MLYQCAFVMHVLGVDNWYLFSAVVNGLFLGIFLAFSQLSYGLFTGSGLCLLLSLVFILDLYCNKEIRDISHGSCCDIFPGMSHWHGCVLEILMKS
jgi:hypothetical protein